MNKKKWGLLLLAALLLFGYYKLFYKTYSEKMVAKSADCVVAIDVKRITNTLIWNFITSPSQWKTPNFSSSKTKEIDWKDMVEIPDYVLAFHARNQPAAAWYTLLNIKDKEKFKAGVSQFGFTQFMPNKYSHKESGINLYVQDGQVLVATASLLQAYTAQTIDELFTKKSFIAKTDLKKIIDLKSHVAAALSTADIFAGTPTFTANFDKEKIEISGNFTPKAQYSFNEINFSYADTALFTAGVAQPPAAFYALLNAQSKRAISKALNFNIDSLVQPYNNAYILNLNEIKTRADSAVTYTYDDEFNEIAHTTVNNIQEPAFNFAVNGANPNAFYNYLLANKKLETTDAGSWFLPMPLVKSYCSVKNQNQLSITSHNYVELPADKTIQCVFYANMLISKIPKSLQKYFPDVLKKAISNLNNFHIAAVKKQGNLLLTCVIQKKKNDLPIINF